MSVDKCPALSTSNTSLYIVKVGPSTSKIPHGGRFMDVQERAAVCGVLWESVNGLCSDRQHAISFGNMIPVDLAGCVLARIMEAWATFEHVALSSGMHSPFACADDESGDEQLPCF